MILIIKEVREITKPMNESVIDLIKKRRNILLNSEREINENAELNYSRKKNPKIKR